MDKREPKKREIIFLLLCLLFILASKRSGAETTVTEEIPAVRPQIEVIEPTFDFGSVYEGDQVPHTFKFKNVGNAILKISRVRATCGCTTTRISNREIAPGEFGEVEAIFRTTGFTGRQRKTIYIHSNDPLKPVTKLELKGHVKVGVEVKPRRLVFKNVQKDTAVTRELEIKQVGEEELVLGEVTTNLEYLKIDSVEKKLGDKKVYIVRVTLEKDAPVGNIHGVVEVNTNLERWKTVKVWVSGKVVGDIRLSPEWMRFTAPAGERQSFSLLISTRGSNFKILRIENKVKYLSAKLYTLEESRRYKVDFSLDPEAPPGRITGKVRVYTDYPGETELIIPITGMVLPKKVPGLEQPRSREIEIAYFFERGCLDCDRARDDFQSLKVEFPNIIVKNYNIESQENMKLNETLCEIYNVPEQKRMTTPSVFIGKDFISGKSITKEKLVELIGKYKDGASLPWQSVRQMTESAEERIVERFHSFGIVAIMGAGILDGINPCAFATMIFFISYLAIARRKRRELLITGFAFTSSVFITYFLIGIGIFEFLNYLAFLETFTKFVYGIMGIFTLILGFMSMGDYFRCRRGKAKEMRLQLPAFLKRKIHSTIRKGVGLRRYVLAAFITGFVVSVLELSCTGQVYLPTIVYATGISQLRSSAYTYLLLYNLMFIVPLLVVFLLAYFGTTSIGLSDILGKNIALIKLLTSILFFIFAAFLITMFII